MDHSFYSEAILEFYSVLCNPQISFFLSQEPTTCIYAKPG